MRTPHKLIVALGALLSLAAAGCSDAEEPSGEGSEQALVGTFPVYRSAGAADYLSSLFANALYQGTTAAGEPCTLTISRVNASHLFAASMGIFTANGLTMTRIAIHPSQPDGRAETPVRNWSSDGIALSFDVNFEDDGARVDANVALVTPAIPGTARRKVVSITVVRPDGLFECSAIQPTKVPYR